MANLFKEAEQKQKKSKVKASDKTVVVIKGKKFATELKSYVDLNTKIAELQAELSEKKEYLLEEGIKEYVKLYKVENKNIGSFLLESDKGSNVLFTPMKKYLKVDKEIAKTLRNDYGKKIVVDDTKFSFDSKLVEKYQEQLSKAISGMKIPEKDKNKIIVAKTTFSVEKDTLDNLLEVSKKSKSDIIDVIEDLEIQFQLKNAKA